MPKVDWRWLHSFALVVRHGGISSAAHESHLSQPTLSRHLRALEEFYGAPLLRHANGLSVTALGERVLAHAQAMFESADNIESLAQGNQQLSGSVRLSVSPAIAQHLLPRVLDPIPPTTTNIEILIEGGVSDLLRRESDIAIRLFRPKQLELKTRKVGEIHYAAYVHRKLVGNKRKIRKVDLFKNAINLIGVVNANSREQQLLDLFDLQPESFRLTCDDRGWRTSAVELGLGTGIIPTYIGENRQELLRVEDLEVPIVQEVWLTTSNASINSEATRSLFGTLSERIKDTLALDAPLT